jgi:hypothetical protein
MLPERDSFTLRAFAHPKAGLLAVTLSFGAEVTGQPLTGDFAVNTGNIFSRMSAGYLAILPSTMLQPDPADSRLVIVSNLSADGQPLMPIRFRRSALVSSLGLAGTLGLEFFLPFTRIVIEREAIDPPDYVIALTR